jgi:GTP-binding protein
MMQIAAIVGRPNVGKSTLFNRIVGQRSAIVESMPGVTRDRIYGTAEWNRKKFMIVDTGGFIPGSENQMEKAVREQAEIAISEADTIIFVCDGKEGITPFDEDIADILRQSNKPIILVINKCDNHKEDNFANEFYKFGLGFPYPISSISGRNTGEFLDSLVENFKSDESEDIDTRLKIAFVGRPNAGKSSLTNALLGKERSIVTEIPGTTRDAVDSVLKYYGKEIILIDTAGLRKRSQIKENVEMYSIMRTVRAIERCDIGVVIIDALRGLEDQDKKIINQVSENRKGMIIAVNKWDLVEKDYTTADNYMKNIERLIPGYYYVPIIFVSAYTKQRLSKILKMSIEIDKRRKTIIKTSELNEVLLPHFNQKPPPSVKGFDLRINYITQAGTEPPKFIFFLNKPELLPDSYKVFMEKTLRKEFDFTGTPLSFLFRRKNKPWEERDEK